MIQLVSTTDTTTQLHLPHLICQVAEQGAVQFGGRGEATDESKFVGFALELPQLFMLPEIDLVWVDRPTGKVEHSRFSSAHELIDFLNRAGDSATPVLLPSFVQNIPTNRSELATSWRLIASCGLTPVSGLACVSHLTGSRTVASVAACCAFQSVMTSVAT